MAGNEKNPKEPSEASLAQARAALADLGAYAGEETVRKVALALDGKFRRGYRAGQRAASFSHPQ